MVDISPLNVRKRTLPAVPSVSSNGGPRSQSSGSDGHRMSSTPVSQGSSPLRPNNEADGRNRMSSTSKAAAADGDVSVLDDDFDYISAYVDDGRRQSQVVNGYDS